MCIWRLVICTCIQYRFISLINNILPRLILSPLGHRSDYCSEDDYLDKKSTSATICYRIRAEQVTADENGTR